MATNQLRPYQPVDADILFTLKQKTQRIPELKAYQPIILLFSKSGFTDRLLEVARKRKNVILINHTEIIQL